MDNSKTIACVTGVSGMVGSEIVQRLVSHGYKVRALSRSKYFDDPDVELFRGGLEDEEVLKSFLSKADFLFHCAAELYDESKMWDANVLGTLFCYDKILFPPFPMFLALISRLSHFSRFILTKQIHPVKFTTVTAKFTPPAP